MLRFDLRHLLDDYQAKSGIRLSYEELGNMTGISVDTLKSIVSREDYNTTLATISKIASSLALCPIKYFTWQTYAKK